MMFMSIQHSNDNFELIVMLLQNRIGNIDIERAYTLANMAIRGECPGEDFSDEECDIWNAYRYWIEGIK